jgi:general secretion pathway protein J
VLVAMSIMAILAVMSWRGVDGIVQARAASQERLEKLLRVQTVLAQWEQDLYAVQDPGSAVPAVRFDGATLRLIRRAPSGNGLQLVVWSLREGTWMRWAGPAVTTLTALQENWLSSQQFIGTEPGQLRALTQVSDLQMYFFRDNTWSNAQSSAGTQAGSKNEPGTPAPAEAPPLGVRMVLTFAEGQMLAGSVTRDVALGPQQ